ncbi:Hsp20/alpha crystallin family protein [Nodularia harveyana UHCC-0300]|uniref:Hsp20/alpha crystallin family protein n=1 Tax=Nodularia harveyana UHCC-0300 TaxID=2974287 RepID=A0ABU5UIR8_9CYAN|nr:Hsp20/alpha crystallin family protein [Nodularia harveyana]MEA5583412.1 Hsp20/alpha crystallin family protein [Nodularia harveyana UHCC-0300]
MALIRWEPFREMELLRRQMDQLFSEMSVAEPSKSEVSPVARTAWVPAVEVHDNGSELILRAEIPGVDSKDLDVQVTQDAISIAGEHHYKHSEKSHGNIRSEFRYGKFQRIIPLPSKVQNQEVKADLKDGILTLTLPKLEPEQNKVFKVNFENTATIESSN